MAITRTTQPIPEPPPTIEQKSSGWKYPTEDGGRDLRIDFIRGIVMLSLIVSHISIFSAYNIIVWERFGIVSGAEGFVCLSGVVIGMIYGRRLISDGWSTTISRLVDRSTQLYRINIFVITSIFLLSFLPYLNAEAVMTFTNQFTKEVYQLYPNADLPLQNKIARVLLLKSGPHQFQIMGLYVVLLFFSPIALWMLKQKRTMLLLGLCWLLYIYNWAYPARPTGAQFEYAFPVLTWQLIYFHGLAAGYHRKKLGEIMQTGWRKPILFTAGFLSLIFLFFTQNNPNPDMPSWAKMSVIPADFFRDIYTLYFRKNTLGILRLVNFATLFITGYYLMTRFWKFFDKTIGWFFIPIGQATLYVFITHIYLVWIISNVSLFAQGNMWFNTVAHSGALAILWLMVRHKILYKIVPR